MTQLHELWVSPDIEKKRDIKYRAGSIKQHRFTHAVWRVMSQRRKLICSLQFGIHATQFAFISRILHEPYWHFCSRWLSRQIQIDVNSNIRFDLLGDLGNRTTNGIHCSVAARLRLESLETDYNWNVFYYCTTRVNSVMYRFCRISALVNFII